MAAGPFGPVQVTWCRLRVTLERLGLARLTIDADFHCRVADERDDTDGDYREQKFHLALLSRSWLVAFRLVTRRLGRQVSVANGRWT